MHQLKQELVNKTRLHNSEIEVMKAEFEERLERQNKKFVDRIAELEEKFQLAKNSMAGLDEEQEEKLRAIEVKYETEIQSVRALSKAELDKKNKAFEELWDERESEKAKRKLEEQYFYDMKQSNNKFLSDKVRLEEKLQKYTKLLWERE
jgi:hypothetical protein